MRLLTILRCAVAVSALCAGAASAFYQEPAKPPGTGGSPGGWTYRPPAPAPINGGRIGGGSVTINHGTGSVTRPLIWKLKPGAGRAIAGGVIRGGALGVVLGLGEWAADQCIHQAPGGGWLLRCGKPDEPYLPAEVIYTHSYRQGQFRSLAEGCPKGTTKAKGKDIWECEIWWEQGKRMVSDGVLTKRLFCAGPPATYSDDGRCSMPSGQKEGRPITPDQAENILANAPLPPVAPPGVDLPVADPVWNPSPGPNPKPRPLTMPIGDPVPHLEPSPAPDPEPGAQPQPDKQKLTWTQPAVEITHSPTEDQPLRMEMKPVDIPVSGPADRQKVSDGKPAPAASGGNKPPADTGPVSGGAPREEFDLCKAYPEIVACQELGEAEEEDLIGRTVSVSFSPDASFHRAGHCPADRSVDVFGQRVTFSMRPMCEFASSIRPLIVAMAAFVAAGIIIGAGRRA